MGARLAALALLAFCALAAAGQWTLAKIERAWPAAEAEIATRATSAMHDQLARITQRLAHDAARALDAPAPAAAAFDWIAPLARGPGDRGVVLYRAGAPVAWAGRIIAPIDSSGSAFAVVRSSFYTVLQATATRGQSRAIATAVLMPTRRQTASRTRSTPTSLPGRMSTALRCRSRHSSTARCRGRGRGPP